MTNHCRKGGVALPGFTFSGEGAWFFSQHWGIGGYAGYHAHPVDVRVLGYEKVQADISLEDLTIRSDPYRVYNLMAGIFTSWPVMNNLRITGKAAGGVTYAATPYQLYKAEYFFIGRFWYDITSAGDFEASFVAGTGLEYSINGCLGLKLQGDITYNAMEFDFRTSDGSVRTDHHKVVFMNVSAGLVFNL
jgi:hypothetical protein